MAKQYCALNYYGVSVNQDGTLDPCCQYTRSESTAAVPWSNFQYFQDTVRERIHADAQAGLAHPGCQKCWREESAGWTTLRQFANRWYPLDANPGFYYTNHAKQSTQDINPIRHVELRLGNYCNLKCIMCTPGSSSLVQAERTQYKQEYAQVGLYALQNHTQLKYWEDPGFLDFCRDRLLKDVERINITGGEPFMVPQVQDILDQLLPRKDQCRISFDTNLTVIARGLLDRLAEFPQVEIAVSLEGTHAHNNYIRYPSQWNIIEGNIALLRQRVPQAKISINHTLQHTSAYALPALAEYAQANNLSLHMTMVQGWDYLTLDTVPEPVLNHFVKWINSTGSLTTEQRTFLNNVSQVKFCAELYKQFRSYVLMLDSIRGTNFDQTFIN